MAEELQTLDVKQFDTSKCSSTHGKMTPGSAKRIQHGRQICAGGVEGNLEMILMNARSISRYTPLLEMSKYLHFRPRQLWRRFGWSTHA